jgi:5'(3')-deoxyribonucleotidase
MNDGLEEKDVWLDKYMPFIKKDNRVIISREAHNMMKSADLKARYLKQYNESEDTIILIDDDPRVLSAVMDACPDVILYKDTVLVD